MGQCATQVVDAVLGFMKFGGPGTACALHVTVSVAVALLAIYPLVCYFSLAGNVHVAFWMGAVPELVCIASPAALLSLGFVAPVLDCTRSNPVSVKAILIATFVGVGSVVMLAGLYVVQLGLLVSHDLISSCGSAALTQQVEAEWDRLSTFREACAEQQGEKEIYVQQCAGFDQMQQPPHAIFVDYIEELEEEYDCQGFCRFWARPLFAGEEGGRRCASVLGEEMHNLAYMVGFPVAAVGILAAGLGAMLAHYDHL